MKTYNMSIYGGSITNEIISEKISTDLEKFVSCDDKVTLDFSNVNLLTTTCIKKIFSKIKDKIPADIFFTKFCFINVNENLKIIINHGLEDLY